MTRASLCNDLLLEVMTFTQPCTSFTIWNICDIPQVHMLRRKWHDRNICRSVQEEKVSSFMQCFAITGILSGGVIEFIVNKPFKKDFKSVSLKRY